MKSSSKMANHMSETSPLLSPPNEADGAINSHPKRPKWQTARVVTNLMTAMILLASLGDRIMESPQTRINEAVICYNWYEKNSPSDILLDRAHIGPGAIGGVAESLCKIDEVQDDLAMLSGWSMLFDGIPSVLLAMPYGWIADRYGRKPVLVLGLVTTSAKVGWVQIVTWYWQTFDIRLSWLSSLAFLFSGGTMTFASIVFVSLSDVTPETGRAAVFLRVTAFNLLAGLLMPPVASWLMNINPWIPSIMGTAMFASAALLFLIIPETLGFRSHHTPEPIIIVEEDDSDHDIPNPKDEQRWRTYARKQVACLRTTASFLTDDWRIPALMLPALGNTVIGVIGPLFLQYLSKRYTLTLSTATLLLLIRSAVVTVVFFFVLPGVSTLLLSRYHFSGQRKDLYLARWSQLLMGVGCIATGLAPNVALVSIGIFVAALGQGANTLIRAFMISLIPPRRIARTFSVLGICESVGAMGGAPLIAELMKVGARLGGEWVGLPFTILGIVTVSTAGLLFVIGIRPGEDELHLVREEEERREDI